MKTSANGIAFIKEREGFTSTPKDDNGRLMWGYGHDRQGFERVPESITSDAADALLLEDLAIIFEPQVSRMAPWATQNQFDALIDFAYNLGTGALATMLHHGRSQVPYQITAWCYEHVNGVAKMSPGLLTRRRAELALYGS